MATPTYTLIEEQVLGSSAASVTFSSIPSTYKDLVLECVVGETAGTGYFAYRLNADTAANYSRTILKGDGISVASSRVSNEAYGYLSPASVPASLTDVFVAHLMGYSNSTTYKTTIARRSVASAEASTTVSLWRSTAAVTSLTVLTATADTFLTGSTFRLWGIA